MSFTKQTRTVTAEVRVIQCDGPECQVTVPLAQDSGERVPDGWYVLEYTNRYHYTPFASSGSQNSTPFTGYILPDVWHFHSAKCLNIWIHASDLP